MNILIAFLFREISIEKTYRFNFIFKNIGGLVQLLVFFYISKLVKGYDYFSFVFIGLIFSRLLHFWINVFSENIRMEQYWGTSELVFSSGNKPLNILLSNALVKFTIVLLEIIVFVIVGILVFKVDFNFSNLIKVIPLILINCTAFMGLGLISGGFIMYFKKGDPVNWIITVSLDLVSGVYFPVILFPLYIRKIFMNFPTTQALNLWRDILLKGINPSIMQIVFSMIWTVVLFVLGVFVFRYFYRKVRINGDLGSY